jgi:transposase, IS30 family
MKAEYGHLNLEERERLYSLKEQGFSLREIGRRLGRSHSSLSRELARNVRYGNEYIPCKAEKKAQKRSVEQRYQAPLKNTTIILYVREQLRLGFSPEAIAGRLPVDHPGERIDDETIYRYIYNRKNKRKKLWESLPRARKKRMKKEGRKVKRSSKIPHAISIDRRPKSIGERNHPGHWETDLMEGKKTDKSVICASVERLTRLVALTKLPDKKAQSKVNSLVSRLTVYPKKFRKTLTMDNGSENTYHQQIKTYIGMNSYFCHPYHSWEKGTVENTIGRLRRFIPKGTSIDEISEEYLKQIEERMNNTPRKCLGFMTPLEMKLAVLKYY